MEDAFNEAQNEGVGVESSSTTTMPEVSHDQPGHDGAIPYLYALRVVQLDAMRLDRLLASIIRKRLGDCLEPLRLAVIETYPAEVDFSISSALYMLSMASTGRTYGQRLMNLRYVSINGQAPSRARLTIHFIVSILIPWAWERYTKEVIRANIRSGTNQDSRIMVSSAALRAVKVCDKITAALHYLNYIEFLRNGQYISIADRLAGFISVYASKSPRRISYQLLTREILWQGLSEFAIFILPYINLRKIRRFSRHLVSIGRNLIGSESDYTEVEEEFHKVRQPMNISDYMLLSCCSCGTSPPSSACQTKCGHIYCYYCVASEVTAGKGECDCPQCGESVTHKSLSYLGPFGF